MKEEEIQIHVGDTINGCYKLILKIAEGENITVFSALDTSMKQVAIILEKDNRKQTSICVESAVLKILGIFF